MESSNSPDSITPLLESEQSTLVSCRKHLEYRSTYKQEKGSYYSTGETDHEEAEKGAEVNSPIEQVALTVATTDDPSLPVFTFSVGARIAFMHYTFVSQSVLLIQKRTSYYHCGLSANRCSTNRAFYGSSPA